MKKVLSLVLCLLVLPFGGLAKADIFSDIGKAASDAWDWTANAAEDAADWTANAASDAWDWTKNAAEDAADWTSNAANAAWNWTADAAEDAAGWTANAANDAWNWASAAGSWIGQNATIAAEWIGDNASIAGNWIVENGIIVGAWIGQTASGAAMWIGENTEAIGTCIGTTVTGISIWVEDTVTDVGKWITENAIYAQNGIAVIGDDIVQWGYQRAEDVESIAVDVYEYVKNIDPSVLLTKEYYLQSAEKLLLGEYSTADATGLSIGINVIASIVNLDLLFDIRDLAYDIQYIGDGSIGIVQLGIDAASCLPVIGIIKNVKYVDQISDAAKLIDGITDIADTAKDIENAVEIVDDVKDITRAVDSISDLVKISDNVDDVSDIAKAADTIADTTDEVKAFSEAADTIDEVKDVTRAADVADGIQDTEGIIRQVSKNSLPEDVQAAFGKYSEDGWTGLLPDATEGTSAGKAFNNWERELPMTDNAGNLISYKEFDALPYGMDPDFEGRGVKRFVIGSDGCKYYTPDHYNTFVQIID